MRKLGLVLLMVFPIVAWAGFGLPGIGDIKIPVKIPGLDSLMNPNNDPITTSIADAVTEIPFLDAYAPEHGALIGLLPHGPNGTINLLPGLWEGTFRSYCLHAGTYGPTQGDGYLYAPLKGPSAGVIQHILQNSASHLEIPQHNVQVLIWAILARTKISDCGPEIQQTAQTLMTKQEIDKCNGGALGKIPPAVLAQASANLPPMAQQCLQADGDIRGMLMGQVNVPYDKLERVAVLNGDCTPPKGSRDVPGGRWSYQPEGFFEQFFPDGYWTTRTMFYTPEAFNVGADAKGRITTIEDRQGVRVEVKYDDATAPLTFTGDAAVKGYEIASLKLTGPDPKKPGLMKTVNLPSPGWIMVGTPNGKGRDNGPGDAFADAQNRYNWAVGQWKDLGALNASIGKLIPKRLAPKSQDLGNLMDLASFAEGLRAAVAGASDKDFAKWAVAQVGVVYRAWMTAASNLGAEGSAGHAETRLASAGEIRLADDVSPMTPLPKPGRHGGHDNSGSTASPGNTGKQRLAQSGAKAASGNGNDTISKARKITGGLSTGTSVAWRVGTGSAAPWGIPAQGVGQVLKFNYDTWGTAANALAGDPPRDDYQQIATADQLTFTAAQGDGKVSQARLDAFNAFYAAALDLTAKLRALNISIDRYGGATKAGDAGAADQQVGNIADLQRQAGFSMLTVANTLEALVKVCRDEGYQFPIVTVAGVKAYQDGLRANGFSADELAAARSIGLTDKEIEDCRQLRLSVVPEDITGSMDRTAGQVVDTLRELGNQLTAVPMATGQMGSAR